MPFIGNQPTAVPLTGADLEDGIITSAKIADGTIASVDLASGVGGKVLQVVNTLKQDTFTTSSDSLVDITGMSASITPSSSANKILILVSLTYGGADYNFHGQLLRNSTQIAKASSGTNPVTLAMSASWRTSYDMYSHSISFLDTPSTTSAITYKMQVRSQVTGGVFYLNRSYRDDAGADLRGVSSITLMEIAG